MGYFEIECKSTMREKNEQGTLWGLPAKSPALNVIIRLLCRTSHRGSEQLWEEGVVALG